MVNMASLNSFNDTQNTSTLNMSNVEQKKEYHKLLEKLSLLDNDSVDNKQRVDGTMTVLNEAKSLASAASTSTSVALLDSYVLRQAGRQALTAATNIEANTNVYNPLELAQHVRENPSFWQFGLPRRVASAASLHGAFEPAPPPPPPPRAARRRAQQAAALRKPDNIATLEKPQEDVVMLRRMQRAIDRACGRGPLSYLHCVLDPASFARTVHNAFYLAFLLRDGKVAVYVDEERGIPMVRRLPSAERPARDISLENQFVVSLDMARWKQLVKACNIKQAMMNLGRDDEGRGDGGRIVAN